MTLLCRALAGDARARRRPPAAADWRLLVQLALETHVATALHASLARGGWLDCVPPDVAEHLLALRRLNRDRNRALLAELALASRLLNDADVVPAVLKGAALLVDGVYADRGERLLTDLDLLVPRVAVARSRRALLAAGYAPLAHRAPHHLEPLAHPARRVAIELHWQLVPESRGVQVLAQIARDTPDAWRPAVFDGARLRVPSPMLLIGHRVAHDMLHDRGYLQGRAPLRGLLDVQRLVDSHGGHIDWRALDDHFERCALDAVFQAYRYTLHRHFPAVPPPSARASARLWHWRAVAQQRWPPLYTGTRDAFHRLRPWLPRQWLRYWGWQTTTVGG